MSVRTRCLASAILMIACVGGSGAVAQVPNRIGYTGSLGDDSGPLNRPVDIVVSVFDAPFAIDGGAALWTETHSDVDVMDGVFSISLGSQTTLPTDLFDRSPLYLEFTVDGEQMTPRASIDSVPYALRSGTAARLIGFDPASAQRSIDVNCGADSYLYAISASGEASCRAIEIPDGVSGVLAGAGLTRTADAGTVELGVDFAVTQARLGEQCPEGQVAYGATESGSWLCRPDQNDRYVAGLGLSLSDGAFAVDTTVVQRRLATTSCPFGIRAIDGDGNVTCADDNDTNTTYGAGLGLALVGTEFAVDPTATQLRVVADCPFGIRSISQEGSVTCAANNTTTYGAGLGLSLTGTTFAVDPTVVQQRVTADCVHGIRTIAVDGSVTCATTSSPTGLGQTCLSSDHFMYGTYADGSPRCRPLSDYINNSCVLWIGQSDNNRPCCERWVQGAAVNTAYDNQSNVTFARRGAIAGLVGRYQAIQPGGTVDSNDWLHFAFVCQ